MRSEFAVSQLVDALRFSGVLSRELHNVFLANRAMPWIPLLRKAKVMYYASKHKRLSELTHENPCI